MTRNAKIARLPLAIRQQLNLRLQSGELAQDLLSWLNQLPEVQAILAAHFDAKPIDESNLSHWKQGGYLDARNRSASAKSWASVRIAARRRPGKPASTETRTELN
ncbi:MAG: hypothetical protein ACLQVY_11865 [Limisphaerales bacterium]